jgi:hypothetical protein
MKTSRTGSKPHLMTPGKSAGEFGTDWITGRNLISDISDWRPWTWRTTRGAVGAGRVVATGGNVGNRAQIRDPSPLDPAAEFNLFGSDIAFLALKGPVGAGAEIELVIISRPEARALAVRVARRRAALFALRAFGPRGTLGPFGPTGELLSHVD